MIPLRVTAVVHGGPDSIESTRIRSLSRGYPSDFLRVLFRQEGIDATARAWNRDIAKYPPDLLYILNTAAPGSLLAPWWRMRKSLRYILDTGDAVYEMARTSGIGAGWRLPLLWTFERLAQQHAEVIVVRGTRHRELLQSQGRRQVRVIRDGYAENQVVSPKSVEVLRAKLGLTGRFVLGVMGSTILSPRLGICYGWDLIEALAQLKDLPVAGLIIGDGSGLPWLRERAQTLGVAGRIVFTGRIPYSDVPLYLRLMDTAFSTQTNNLPGQVRTTGKIPEYMAAGRFILASRVGEAELLLPEPMLIDYHGEVDLGYPVRVACRIRTLIASEDLRNLGATLPARVLEHCSYDNLALEWNRLINDLRE